MDSNQIRTATAAELRARLPHADTTESAEIKRELVWRVGGLVS